VNDNNSPLTRNDIECQAETLRAIFESFRGRISPSDLSQIRAVGHSNWVFTGCGTTYALGLSLAALYRRSCHSAIALPASEMVFYPDSLPVDSACLMAISRSGETSETLWAVDRFRQQCPQGLVLALTADPHASLAKASDIVLDVHEARDQATVETRSFTGMLLAGQALCSLKENNLKDWKNLARVPEIFLRLVPESKIMAEEILTQSNPTRFFFLGAGPLYGAACQAAFTLKECAGQWAEAFHPLEFRHGPRTTATQGSLVVLLASENRMEEELRVLNEMHNQGAGTLIILEDQKGFDLSGADTILELSSGLDIWDRTALFLPLLQWLAFFRTIKDGKDPDHPSHLKAVTKL
jgi:glutamine---fructose-6-phosphate transaminase (isomerizing)